MQGIADALTFGKSGTNSGTGDLQRVAFSGTTSETFSITFSVNLSTASIKDGYKQIPSTDTAGDAVTIDTAAPYYDDTNGTGFTINVDRPVSYSVAHNYDEEAIKIGGSPSYA